MWSDNYGVITPAPHRENPWEVHYTDPWGGIQRRGVVNICGVIPMCPDISGMPGGGVSCKFAQPGKDLQTLHVQAL